eukprot:1924081-Prymnesium_polylepis.1
MSPGLQHSTTRHVLFASGGVERGATATHTKLTEARRGERHSARRTAGSGDRLSRIVFATGR